jgi:hypothetical protein
MAVDAARQTIAGLRASERRFLNKKPNFAFVFTLLRDPRNYDGKHLSITASIGAVLYPEHDRNATALLGDAEIALHRAKNAGRNRFVIFETNMRDEVEQRIALLREIRSGIERGEFVLYYQPLVRIAKPRAVTGFEALTRWQHPSSFLYLNALSNFPGPLRLFGFLVAVDFCRYWKHRWLHSVPFLQAFHSIHQAPDNLNILTAYRIHFVSTFSTELLC